MPSSLLVFRTRTFTRSNTYKSRLIKNQHSTNNEINLGQTNYFTRLYVLTLQEEQLILVEIIKVVGCNSMVNIPSQYGLDSLGSNPGGDEILHAHPDQHCGPPSLLHNGNRVSFLWIRWLWCGNGHPPPV